MIVNNGMWILSEIGPRLFTADTTEKNRYHPEHRLYFSKEELERDFGKIDMEEKDIEMVMEKEKV